MWKILSLSSFYLLTVCNGNNYVQGQSNVVLGTQNKVNGDKNFQLSHNVDTTGSNNMLVGANHKVIGDNIHMFGPTANIKEIDGHSLFGNDYPQSPKNQAIQNEIQINDFQENQNQNRQNFFAGEMGDFMKDIDHFQNYFLQRFVTQNKKNNKGKMIKNDMNFWDNDVKQTQIKNKIPTVNPIKEIQKPKIIQKPIVLIKKSQPKEVVLIKQEQNQNTDKNILQKQLVKENNANQLKSKEQIKVIQIKKKQNEPYQIQEAEETIFVLVPQKKIVRVKSVQHFIPSKSIKKSQRIKSKHVKQADQLKIAAKEQKAQKKSQNNQKDKIQKEKPKEVIIVKKKQEKIKVPKLNESIISNIGSNNHQKQDLQIVLLNQSGNKQKFQIHQGFDALQPQNYKEKKDKSMKKINLTKSEYKCKEGGQCKCHCTKSHKCKNCHCCK